MLDIFKDDDGYVTIFSIRGIKLKRITDSLSAYSFVYEGKNYYFKENNDIFGLYNEVIAEEVAREYGISCAHYEMAEYVDRLGVVTESVHESSDKYISMENILDEYLLNIGIMSSPQEKNIKNFDMYNNLDDIGKALRLKYDIKTTDLLLSEIINMYMFDMLIGCMDRSSRNFGIVENESGVHLSPIFDNQGMLNEECITTGGYSLGIDINDYFYSENDKGNFIDKFLNIYGDEYVKKLRESLNIINSDNIIRIIKIVEERMNHKIETFIIQRIINRFETNYRMIDNVLKKYEVEKVR